MRRKSKTLFVFIPLISLFLAFCGFLYFGVGGKHPVFANCPNPSVGTDNINYQINGLLSTKSVSGPLKGTSNSGCVIDTVGAPIDPTDVSKGFYSYSTLKTQFYDKASRNTNFTVATATSVSSFKKSTYNLTANDTIFHTMGDLNVDNGSPGPGSSASKVGVFFVDGNLNIQHDITYPKGLVFIVQGDINIYNNVTQINAILVSQGTICTYYTSSCTNSASVPTAQSLTINGSLISLNQAKPMELERNLLDSNGNTTPGELINYDPKYLYILRYLMGQNFTVTTEGTTYAGNP